MQDESEPRIIGLLNNGVDHFLRFRMIYDPDRVCPTLDTRCDRNPKILLETDENNEDHD